MRVAADRSACSLTICLSGCNSPAQTDGKNSSSGDESAVSATKSGAYYTDTKIQEVISEPVFGDYGRLIFPVESAYYSGGTLGSLWLTRYNNTDPNKTVEIANYMKALAEAMQSVGIETEFHKYAGLSHGFGLGTGTANGGLA